MAETTTTAPTTTTTAAATTTTAPPTTTTAPPATTTAPPTTTTAPPTTTTTAPATTTTAPATTTTAPATTTTAPATTTTAPATTTTAPATTTTAPGTTTTAPGTTTTAAGTTTTAPGTTTTAPGTTTTAPGTTTTGPATTTTAGGPTVDEFSGGVMGGDGSQLADSLQVDAGTSVTLTWKVSNAADGVELTDPAQADPQKFDSSTNSTDVTPQSDTQDYTLVAIAGDKRSEPKTVHVSTHTGGHVYSPHSKVLPPNQPPQVNYFRVMEQGGDASTAADKFTAAPGATLTLAWEVEGDVAKIEVDNDVGDVTGKTATDGDTSGEGTVDITIPADASDSLTYTLTLSPEDAGGSDVTATVTVTVQPATTTTAPATTTTAPATTTTAAATTTTANPGTTTTAKPGPAATTTAKPSTTTTANANKEDIDVDDLDLSFVDPDGSNETITDIEWSHLQFQKDLDIGPIGVVKTSWFSKGLDLKYAKVSGQIEVKFSGKVFTWPGKEKKVDDKELQDKLIKRLNNRIADFAANKPEGKYEPVEVEAKPAFSKPSGKVVDSKWPSIDAGFSFGLKFGEDLEFESELSVIKFEKHDDGTLKGGVGEVEIHGDKAIVNVEMAYKDPDSKETIGAVKGNIFLGIGVTIEPKWDAILETVGSELVGEETISALGFDIGAADIAMVVLTNPEILALAIPFIVVYEIISAIQDGEDLKKLGEAFDELRSKYPQGVMDGIMSVASRFAGNKAYESGYKVGVEGHNRLHKGYKDKFLKDAKNKKWAKGKTDDEIDKTIEKLLCTQLVDSPIPWQVAQKVQDKVEPGWRHDLYAAFRDAHKGSPWMVRDVAFILCYGDVCPHDNYKIGYDIKTVPSDVFMNSAEPDAWYNHPPMYGHVPPPAPAQRQEKAAPPAPKPGQKVQVADNPPPPPPPQPHPAPPPPGPNGGGGGGGGNDVNKGYDTLDDAMKALKWDVVDFYKLTKDDAPICDAYSKTPPSTVKNTAIVPVNDGKWHIITANAPYGLMLIAGAPPHHLGDS